MSARLRAGRLLPAFAALVLGVVGGCARADSGIDLDGSGFVSLVGGKLLSGTHEAGTDLGWNCPCFIADYARAGVYDQRGWQVGPDSRIGLQGTASMDAGRYSVTAQAVSRGARDGRIDLEWLYASAELGSDWTLQVGRKRLPLFLSSEVQDVGYALPWTHLPPQVYGWEVVNYDGASLNYRGTAGGWLASAQLLYGNETVKDSGYWRIYNGRDSRTESRWSDIAGAELKLSRDWFEARAVWIESGTQSRQMSAGETDFTPRAHQRIEGLSFNADDGTWIGRAEFLYIDRHEDYGWDHAQLYAAGRRFGRWSAWTSYAHYQQTTRPEIGPAEAHSTVAGVLRYELGRASALKLQFDVWHDAVDRGYASQHGNARLLTVAFDQVF